MLVDGWADDEETALKRRPNTVKAMFSSAEEVDEFDAMVKDTVADWARQKRPKTSHTATTATPAYSPTGCSVGRFRAGKYSDTAR